MTTISISKDGFLVRSAQRLARMTDEQVIVNLNENSLENDPSPRLTFFGHAHSTAYGDAEYTPQQFAEHLIDVCKLPKTVSTIDLIGCEIGFIQKGESYVQDFSAALAERGYGHIQVNALTNLGQEKIVAMYVLFAGDGLNYSVIGVNRGDKFKLDPLEAESKRIKAEFYAKTFELAKLEGEGYTHSENVTQPLIDEIRQLDEQLNVNQEARKEIYDRNIIFGPVSDIRRTLDTTSDFNFNPVYCLLEKIEKEIAKHQADYEEFYEDEVLSVIEQLQQQYQDIQSYYSYAFETLGNMQENKIFDNEKKALLQNILYQIRDLSENNKLNINEKIQMREILEELKVIISGLNAEQFEASSIPQLTALFAHRNQLLNNAQSVATIDNEISQLAIKINQSFAQEFPFKIQLNLSNGTIIQRSYSSLDEVTQKIADVDSLLSRGGGPTIKRVDITSKQHNAESSFAIDYPPRAQPKLNFIQGEHFGLNNEIALSINKKNAYGGYMGINQKKYNYMDLVNEKAKKDFIYALNTSTLEEATKILAQQTPESLIALKSITDLNIKVVEKINALSNAMVAALNKEEKNKISPPELLSTNKNNHDTTASVYQKLVPGKKVAELVAYFSANEADNFSKKEEKVPVNNGIVKQITEKFESQTVKPQEEVPSAKKMGRP